MTGQDTQCERELIALMLNSDKALIKAVCELTADDFTRQDLKQIFIMICEMYEANKKVDITSLYVENKDDIVKMLGTSYAETFSLMITSGADAMIDRLKNQTKARHLSTLSAAIKKALVDDKDCDDIYTDIENEIIKHTSTGVERVYISPKAMAQTCLQAMNDRRKPELKDKKVINTSFKYLNEVTGGFEKGDLIILSAETGGGKSAFAMNLANQIGCTQKRPTLYLNSEMSADQMAIRWDSILAQKSHTRLRQGELTEDEVAEVAKAIDKLHNGQLHTLTIPDLQIANVLSETRRAKKQHGIELVIVDYIGRMDTTSSPNRDDWQILKAAAQKLKTMAQDLQIIVIMIAQLNANGKLAQSSYMSHECDLWLNLMEIDEADKEKFYPWNMIGQVKKARNADTSKPIMFRFLKDILTFTADKEMARECYKAEYGELTSESASSSDNEPTSFESFAKAPTKQYRRKTYRS